MANGYSKPNKFSAKRRPAPPGFHYMPDGTLMSDETHVNLYGGGNDTEEYTGNLQPGVPLTPSAPYIGNCYNYESWYECALNKSHSTLDRLYLDQLEDNLQMQFGLNPQITHPIPIIASTWFESGQTWEDRRNDFLSEQWLSYLVASQTPELYTGNTNIPYGLPYRNGCKAFDGVINGWIINNQNLKLSQSQVPGHLDANQNPPNLGNDFPITVAAGVTSGSLHFQWWEYQKKIDWAEGMKECCTCGQTGVPDPMAMMGATDITPIEASPIKVIKKFELNLSDLKAAGETRVFSIKGDPNAKFNLEITNEDSPSKYYNFYTRTFTTTKSGLKGEINDAGVYSGRIVFPTVTDDDHYDIYLYAEENTEHGDYSEVRFGDGTLDINNSTGSNSLLLQKIIYQYTDLTLTLSTFSPSTTIETGSQVNAAITTSRGKTKALTAFTVSCAVTSATKCYQIIKQPVAGDVVSTKSLTVGAAPLDIEGEDIYPGSGSSGKINGAVTSGAVIQIDALVAGIPLGAKVVISSTTDTVNGDFSGGATAITMDTAVATRMAVGYRVTGTTALDAGLFTVASIDSTNVFSLNASAAIDDETTLTFKPLTDRSLTTVLSLDPTSGPNFANKLTLSQDVQVIDNAVITFIPRKNYRWPVDDITGIKEGMTLVKESTDTNVTASSIGAKYEDSTTIFAGTEREQKIINREIAATEAVGDPTITNGVVTAQPGNIIFSNQQALALAGDTIKISNNNSSTSSALSSYKLKFTDLKVALTPVTTTTTAAVINSTSVPVASRNGILDTASSVSGIGINSALADPTVASGAGAVSGAGTIVLSAAQTLENGITLNIANTGQTATITGNVEILQAGIANKTISFNVDNLLSIT